MPQAGPPPPPPPSPTPPSPPPASPPPPAAGPRPVFADHRAHIAAALDAALAAADPYAAVLRAVRGLGGGRAWAKGREGVLIGAGKASIAMARAVLDSGLIRPVAGVVVSPPLPPGRRAPPAFVGAGAAGGRRGGGGWEGVGGGGVRLMEADHPLPTQRNLVAAQAVLDAARTAGVRRVPLVVVLSGGASAHLCLPEQGVTLADIRAVTEGLLRAGVPIDELNTVRKHIEKLKGGRLALAAAASHPPVSVLALILSDVPGDDPAVIASGPTAPDPTTFQTALGVLDARGCLEVAPAVTRRLREGAAGTHPPTPKPGDAVFARVENVIVGSSSLAVVAATEALTALGFRVVDARFEVTGEAAEVGHRLAETLLAARAARPGPVAVIWGGETTVRVGTRPGQAAGGGGCGGRNQEVAVSAAVRLAGVPGVAVASFATDGVDGVHPPAAPPAAGGVVTGRTAEDAAAGGVDLAAALREHDTYAALARLGAHLGQGPTGTNVNDVAIGLAY